MFYVIESKYILQKNNSKLASIYFKIFIMSCYYLDNQTFENMLFSDIVINKIYTAYFLKVVLKYLLD